MRRIVGYEQGRAVWSDNVPASPPLHASRGGTLVVGGPSISARALRRREANAEAARRYRERQAAT